MWVQPVGPARVQPAAACALQRVGRPVLALVLLADLLEVLQDVLRGHCHIRIDASHIRIEGPILG